MLHSYMFCIMTPADVVFPLGT